MSLLLDDIDAFVEVAIETTVGVISIHVYINRAPITAINFLKLVETNEYAGGSFYRAVRVGQRIPGNLELIQGGILPRQPPFPPIKHETTRETGILHDTGVVSMARRAPGTGCTEFFICLRRMSILDFSSGRSTGKFDGYGYASFGRVVGGLETVRKIQEMPSGVVYPNLGPDFESKEFEEFRAQILKKKVPMLNIRRV